MIRNCLKIFTPLLVVVPLLTCSLPPYDEGLSLGWGTAKKMVELGAERIKVGPIWVWDFDFRDRDYYFIPNKGVISDDFRSGFIARVEERFFDLSYVEYLPSDYYELWQGWGIDITNDDSNRLNFHAETMKWGPFLSFIRFDAKDYQNNQYFRIEWMPGNFDVPDVLGTGPPPPYPKGHLRSFIHSNVFGSDPAKNPTIIGSSIFPKPFADPSDEQAFLCKFDGSGLFAEVVYDTDPGNGIVAPFVLRDDLDFNFPDDLENAFYYRNIYTDISYLSYYSRTQREYKNYSWGPGMPANLKPLIDMDRRIDAVLTTGQLLSFENNRCYVYDGEGEKQYDFLLGGLHFCYEIEWLGRFTLVFTLPAWLSLRDQEDELYFNVYTFPTDMLSELQ